MVQGDGFEALYRVGVPGEHRALLNDTRVHRILNYFLRVPPHDALYDPYTDCILLPPRAEIEAEMEAKRFRCKGTPLTTIGVQASVTTSTAISIGTKTSISTSIVTSSSVSASASAHAKGALASGSGVRLAAAGLKATAQGVPLCSDVEGDEDIVEISLSPMPEQPWRKGVEKWRGQDSS